MIRNRYDLPNNANRIVIKAGTTVVSTPDGYPSLTRMAAIVEAASSLQKEGREVIIITSGAVGVGKQILRKQAILKHTVSDVLQQKDSSPDLQELPGVSDSKKLTSYNSACAAAGQLGLMSLYSLMFNQFDVQTSQLLVTAFDFTSPERRRNIQYVISQLLAHGIIPLLNENDAVSASQGYAVYGTSFADNDSLASLVSVEMNAHLLILLTDVKGVYDRPPKNPDAIIIDVFTDNSSDNIKIGDVSTGGRGGMGAKIFAALDANKGGVQAVVIASGIDSESVLKIVKGEQIGTCFFRNYEEECDEDNCIDSEIKVVSNESSKEIDERLTAISKEMAKAARLASKNLQLLSSKEREEILIAIANAINDRENEILEANMIDIKNAEKSGIVGASLSRLELTSEKISTLIKGIKSIAAQVEPIGRLISRTEIAEKLILDKISCPIGVLLIIFESRPDCLPQIAALAIRSGNGLLIKGGKEAEKSNNILHKIISETIEKVSNQKVSSGFIGLITSRANIPSLLKLDKYIDLVIPRGSGDLVKYIKDNTRIPVMGHAEGICHVYVDADADIEKTLEIVIDAKTNYPSGCNAVETVLVHESLIETGIVDSLLRSLRSHNVKVFGGCRAIEAGLTDRVAKDFKMEYGELSITIEITSSLQAAIDHINEFGSGHTETIITENLINAEYFLQTVDSACVFHNASTRFADGYRFGLGAEVGISTGRIHARGPVGIEGLMISKWQLRSTNNEGHTVSSFSGNNCANKYTHKKLI